MCLMRKVSPDICMVMNLETETESCETGFLKLNFLACFTTLVKSSEKVAKMLLGLTRQDLDLFTTRG